MTVDELLTISGIGSITNRDRINHLHCRKGQVLAYVASRSRWADLLMYNALGSTFDIYRHCYVRKEYRWSFPTPYLGNEDLRLLGFTVAQADKAALADVPALLHRYLSLDQPLFFYAPRADFAHWVDFMRREGTVEAEYRELHSFLVGGVSADGSQVVIVDNTTDNHEFRQFTLGFDVFEQGWAREPERWFTGCATIAGSGHDQPDLDGFEARYRGFVAGHRDACEIYDLVGAALERERDAYPDTYQAPGVNSLALLAGSRDFFGRFLRLTRHSERLRAVFARNAALITMMQERVGRFHSGAPDVTADALRRDLHAVRVREERAAVALAAELSTLDTLWAPR